jgi:hypothetical protein
VQNKFIMKKAIFILLVCLTIVSCQRSYELNDEVEYYVVEYEYNGHDYILFDTMNATTQIASVLKSNQINNN